MQFNTYHTESDQNGKLKKNYQMCIRDSAIGRATAPAASGVPYEKEIN